MIYCVIPRELADQLYDKMVDYYKDNPNVTVIVDRRAGSNRRGRGGDREGNQFRDRRRVRGGQSLFRLLPRRDVEQVALREELPPVRVLDDQALVLNPDRPSVAGDQPVFGLELLRRLVAVRDEREDSIAIIRMEQLRKELWIAEPLVDRVAEQGLDLRTRVQRRSALREGVDVGDERKLLDQGPVLGLRREQLVLGTRPLQSREKLSVAPQSEHLQSISAAAGVQLIVCTVPDRALKAESPPGERRAFE